jgi:hypothetical protein
MDKELKIFLLGASVLIGLMIWVVSTVFKPY